MSKNDFIKKANVQTEFTPANVLELKKCAEDPKYFINNYCWIQHPVKGQVKFALRPYQERIIDTFHNNLLSVLMISRQAGKSQTTSAYALWYACFIDDSKILIASNKQKGATDIMNRIKYMYERLPDWLRPGTKYYNRGSMQFDNESEIWSEATTDDTGRGRSPSLIICDELAHVNRKIQDNMWTSIMPTISTGGKGIFMSTPNGDQDLFAEIWRGAESGTNGFTALYVPITEIPDRDEAWCEKEKRKIGEIKFNQEYLCHFLSSDALLVNSLILQKLKSKVPSFLDKGFSFWREPDPTKTYMIGADIGQGLGKDFSTIQVFELESLEQIAEFRSNSLKEDQFYNAIKYVIAKVNSYKDRSSGKSPMIYWSYENNAIGATISVLYANDEKFPHADNIELISAENKSGLTTSGKTKPESCRTLKNLLEKTANGIRINSEKLIVELKNYVQRGAGYQARHGSTDDLISAVLIIMQIMKRLIDYDSAVFDKIYSSEQDFYEESQDIFEDPLPFVM